MPVLSVVVPWYNEEEVLPKRDPELCRVAESMGELTFEFDFVDDGSSDGTLDILRRLSREDGRVRFTSFSRNFGK